MVASGVRVMVGVIVGVSVGSGVDVSDGIGDTTMTCAVGGGTRGSQPSSGKKIMSSGMNRRFILGIRYYYSCILLTKHESNRMDLQALIFDMDGVITDTIKLHDRAWSRLALEEGVPYTHTESDAIRGLSREDSILHIFRQRSLTVAEIQTLMIRKNGYFLEYLEEMTPADVLPGIQPLIDEARVAGWKVGLASSSRNVNDVLAKLSIRKAFDAIADAYTVARTKPAPDVFLWTAGRLDVSPQKALILEDSQAGVKAALAGGFFVVGLGDPALVGAAHLVLPDLENANLEGIIRGVRP